MSMTTKIIKYETDEMTHEEILELFQELVNNGMAWQLQGHYGRTAAWLIREGYIKPKED